MRLVHFLQSGGRKYNDSFYDKTEVIAAQQVGIPLEVLRSIRVAGERSNENQVSSAGARGVYQFIPSTRNSVLKKYGVDAWDPNQSSLAAAYLLKENAARNKGDFIAAVREYHGGSNRKNWGSVNQAYANRVSGYLSNNSNIPYSNNVSFDNSSMLVDNTDYSKLIEDMSKGIYDWDVINQMNTKSVPGKELFSDVNIQKSIKERLDLEIEAKQQEQLKLQAEEENKLIAISLKEKEAERNQMLSMIPRAQSINSNNIQPKLF